MCHADNVICIHLSATLPSKTEDDIVSNDAIAVEVGKATIPYLGETLKNSIFL